MSSNEAMIKAQYRDGREEQRAAQSRYAELEFDYTKKHLEDYIDKSKRVLELGCGTGYYAMHFWERCREYVGVDLVPEHIVLLQDKVKARSIPNVTAQVGDATKLTEFGDDCFDVVLCLGPMYHLPPQERALVFAQCSRICRPGGIAAFSYINRAGVYAAGCVHSGLRERYPNRQTNRLVLQQSRDDVAPDLFFFTMPEEIETAAAAYGFSKLKNLGTDFLITMECIEAMDDRRFEEMKPLLDCMASHESCTGLSNHAVLVCKNLK